MLKEITMVTGNIGKWEIASDIFSDYNLELKHVRMETPEIQSYNVEEVSAYSARYAADLLKVAVIKSDVGYYIKELGGFPGPFLRYINEMLSAEDILKLMHNQKDRTIILKECLTYADPSGNQVQFVSEKRATIALKAEGKGSAFDQILILEGYNKPKGTYSSEVNLEYFKKHLSIYHEMAKYLEKE